MNKSNVIIKLTNKGVLIADGKTGNRRKIAAAIKLRAFGQRDRDKVWLAEIRFRTIEGVRKSEFFEFSKLRKRHRDQIETKVADQGYDWPDEESLSGMILKEVTRARPKRRFRLVDAPGWYGSAFVLPHQVFAPKNEGARIYIDAGGDAHVGAFIRGEGSLRDWQDRVAAPSRKSSRLRTSIVAALAAPFLRQLSLDSFGINWFSDTSDGKTLLLIVAASVAGLMGPDGLPGWADTEPALECLARGHRDNILPLDEAGDGEHQRPLYEKAQLIAFLVARNRPRKFAKSHEVKHNLGQRDYRIILVSTSERALRQIAHAAGKRRLGGEEVRFIDIPASEPGSLGIFDEFIKPAKGRTDRETTKDLVENLRADAIKYQGHALCALMEAFMKDPHGLETLQRYKRDFEERAVVAGTHNAQYRIRSNFALFYAAAALAIDYGVLPWRKGGTYQAIVKCMRLALTEIETGSSASAPEPTTPDIQQVSKHLKSQLDFANVVEVKPKEKVNEEQVRDRQLADGFRINGEIFVKPDRFKSWIPGKAERDLLKVNQLLRAERDDTLTVERKIAGISGKPRYYVVDLAALGRPRQILDHHVLDHTAPKRIHVGNRKPPV
jgi:hypothetical protein